MNNPAILQAMKQYNTAIKSYKRAEAYFDDDSVTLEDKKGRSGDCQKLVNHMSIIISKLKALGYDMTAEEVLEGFRQVEVLGL